MRVTDEQVKKLRAEMKKSGRVGVAAARAGMHRNTATKYLSTTKLPSESCVARTWRTREDPFADDWSEIEEKLREDPQLEAKTVFEDLLERKPGRYRLGQLRTLQRRVRAWRAQGGPEKELFFPQDHRPGEAAQTDFTSMRALGITIGGVAFDHLLCVTTLPYSDWSWATPCRSESMAALRKAVPAAFRELGHVSLFHQTDHSTAATHDLRSGKRAFNAEYVELMAHLQMKPRTTGIGRKEQNGDAEAANGALKRYLDQRLRLRGSRDFESVEAYVAWLRRMLQKRNAPRQERLAEELRLMRPMPDVQLPEFSVLDVRVGKSGTIRVKDNTYSVPSRLKGEKVRVRVFDERLEIYFAQTLQLTAERVHGRKAFNINYRHVVPSMLRKPGAFRRYRYREALFPTAVFRRAFDLLEGARPQRRAEIEYLRLLHLAATTMETEVERALAKLIEDAVVPTAAAVREILAPPDHEIPQIEQPEIDLRSYDALLVGAPAVSA